MVYITCAVWLSLPAIPCRDLQEKQDSCAVMVAALCGRWWKGTGLAGSHAAGIPLQMDSTRLWQAVLVGLFSVVGVQLKQEGQVISGDRVRTGWGRLFLKGVSVFPQSFWGEVDSGCGEGNGTHSSTFA